MTARAKSNILIAALAYGAFISLGLPDGLLGVAWPSIRSMFGLRIDALGPLLVIFTAGYLVSSFASGRLLALMSLGMLLSLSCLAMALSLIGYAIAPAWWVMAALGSVAGLGAGAIDAGLNTFAATRFSARMVNWLHECYGVGAATGPVIMTGVLAAHYSWQIGYAIVGGLQLALAVCFAVTRHRWPAASTGAEPSQPKTARASTIDTLKLPAAWLSMAVFFVYTGIEAAAGTWAFSLFTEARGVAMMTAGVWVSVYWGSLTAGRLLSGFVAGFVSADRLLGGCVAGIALGAALLWLGGASIISFIGLGLMGFASAPVFPSMISTTPGRTGVAHTANAVGFQISAAVLGQSLMPAAIGFIAARMGLEIVGPMLLISALALAGLQFSLTFLNAGPKLQTPRAAR